MNHLSTRAAALLATLALSLALAACGEAETTEKGDETLLQNETGQGETPAPHRRSPPTTEVGTSDPSLGNSGIGSENDAQQIKRPPE